MGANKVGDIAELTALAEPTHGMITNIGKAHLEGFGGAEGVVIGKTEMYAFVKQHGGTLFVNGDDQLLMEKSAGITRVTYGTEEGVQTRGRSMAEDAFLTVVFSGRDGDEHQARTRLVGAYNLPNALAAIAIGQHFGIADDRIAGALEAYRPSNSRSQFTDTGRNQLVLDAYNANPTSMAAALENFARLPSDRRKLAILGDMRELGPTSALEHQAIVHQLEKLGIETMLVGGEFMNTNGGSSLRRFADADDLLKALTEEQPNAAIILIKGSRGIKLETVIPAL
ncbi:MAG: Mur ligase family protein, partial [Flavobacteriales bacterium]